MESTRFENVNEAVGWAETRGLRQRAVCYVTRGAEVLVFEYAYDGKQLCVQLPAGGLEPGETPPEAAIREAHEETGLRLNSPAHLVSWHWTHDGSSQVWHYIQLQAPQGTPDAWAHQVTAGSDDAGLTFQLRFAPLAELGLRSSISQFEEAALPELTAFLSSPQTHRRFDDLIQARAFAAAHSLREKAVCHITRGELLLVFDHVPNDSGVQVPAGGIEPGETPAQAASRECAEETGHSGYSQPVYLGSAVWINAEHAKREMRHFFHLLAPPNLPDTWDHDADEHCFRFRWVPLAEPHLDWSFDLILPATATLQELAHD